MLVFFNENIELRSMVELIVCIFHSLVFSKGLF